MFAALLAIAYTLLTLLLFAHASVTLAWMLYTWRSPDAERDSGFRLLSSRPRHSFSLMVPARHEERVLAGTLEGLAASDHPDFEILAIVGHDDDGTREVAEEVARRHPDRIRRG